MKIAIKNKHTRKYLFGLVGLGVMFFAYSTLGVVASNYGNPAAQKIALLDDILPEDSKADVDNKALIIEQYFSYWGDSMSGNYLAGRFASKNFDLNEAAERYQYSLEEMPENMRLMQRTFALMLLSGNVEGAIDVLGQYRIGNGAISSLGQVVLAVDDMKHKRFQEAEMRLLDVMRYEEQNLSDMDVLLCSLMVVWAKAGQEKYDETFELLEVLSEAKELESMWLYHKALISDLAGNTEKARAAFDKSLNSSIKPYHFVEAAGNFYERVGEIEKAKQLYISYQEDHIDDGHFAEDLARIEEGKYAQNPIITSVQMGVNEVLLDVVRALYGSDLYQEALVYLQLALYLDDKLPQAYFMIGMNMEHNERFSEAIAYYNYVPEGHHLHRQASLHKARALYSMKKTDEAKSVLQSLIDRDGNSYSALVVLADMMKEEKKYQQAVDIYNEVIDTMGEPKPKHWSIFYNKAVSLDRVGEWEEAESVLIKSLELNPKQPDVLNYLAYSWLERNKNLATAQEMIEIAIKMRPTDAHIIDSMGWALYKQGAYQEARNFLERALELKPNDPVLHDHLGDVYWKLGRKIEAEFQWKHALFFNAEAQDKEKIERKLAYGLISEEDKKEVAVAEEFSLNIEE